MQSDYEKARKDGERAYRRAVMSGQYPYLPALDSMGQDIDRLAVRDLGVEEVPISMSPARANGLFVIGLNTVFVEVCKYEVNKITSNWG